MTFVFNDVDTMPFVKNFLPYATTKGNIKHFYGFFFALGGIVSVNGDDFERMNGFPNFWAWGYEDNELKRRADLYKITIDRSVFYPLFDRNIIFLQDGFFRTVNEIERKRYDWRTTEGITDITELKYTIENDMINATYFKTAANENRGNARTIDLRSKMLPATTRKKMGMVLL